LDSVLIHSTRYRSSGRVSSLAHHHCRRRTRHSASMDHVGYVEREGERDGILRCGVVCQPSVRNRISDLLVCMDRSTRTLSEFRLSYSPPFFSRFTLLCPEHLTSFEGLTLRFVRYVWYPLYYVTGHGETGYICISRPSLLGRCGEISLFLCPSNFSQNCGLPSGSPHSTCDMERFRPRVFSIAKWSEVSAWLAPPS